MCPPKQSSLPWISQHSPTLSFYIKLTTHLVGLQHILSKFSVCLKWHAIDQCVLVCEHVACCMLHVACCMLHVACCMLHVACACACACAQCSEIWLFSTPFLSLAQTDGLNQKHDATVPCLASLDQVQTHFGNFQPLRLLTTKESQTRWFSCRWHLPFKNVCSFEASLASRSDLLFAKVSAIDVLAFSFCHQFSFADAFQELVLGNDCFRGSRAPRSWLTCSNS